MSKRPNPLPLIVGLILIVAGWVVVYVGWQRAARLDIETGQLPYLLSGGFGGWGLLLLGAAGVVVDAINRAQHRTAQALEDMKKSLERIASLTESGVRAQLRSSSSTETPVRRVRRTTREE